MGVLLASSPFTASPEDDVAAFVIDKTALSACTRIRWGGVGVVEALIADTSLADGLFWPSPSSGICTTGVTVEGGEGRDPFVSRGFHCVGHGSGGCFFVMGGRIRV
jgi:hypothetical protein